MFITVTQPVQPVVSERVVYLKNRVDCNLVKWDIKNIQWGDIVSAQCPVSALHSHIIDNIKEHVPERLLKVRTQS